MPLDILHWALPSSLGSGHTGLWGLLATAFSSSNDTITHSADASAAGGAEQLVVDLSKDPASWGPSMWRSLHCIAHHLPPRLPGESQESFKTLVESLPQLLPCKVCGQHLTQHLVEDPVTNHLATRDDVEQWLVQLHNKVNQET